MDGDISVVIVIENITQEEMLSREKVIIENAITKINKEEDLFIHILNNLYYIIVCNYQLKFLSCFLAVL
jgi:hypothetical protein